jgi:hypothetical protein
VDAGLFHDFHQSWAIALRDRLNGGTLPVDYFALVEKNIHGPIPDALTLRLSPTPQRDADWVAGGSGGVATATPPPRTHLTQRTELDSYLRKANRITVRHRHGDVVAVIEILSPGNKASRAEFRTLVEKSVALLRQGIHLLVIDVFPPGKRDPQGIHKAIWDEFQEEDLTLPPGQPLTLVSYEAGLECVAYVEFCGVGDPLPEMPLFLKPGFYVSVPLDATYQTAWAAFPNVLKGLLESP